MKNQPCKQYNDHYITPLSTLLRVATIILSYLNDTIGSQLGDIETYISSYIYENREKLSLQAARIASGKPQHYTMMFKMCVLVQFIVGR